MALVTTRFAPSPTGPLHLGHAYSALLAWERAQEVGGRFLLRFEDIDHTRVREEYYQGIEDDLRWLGIEWAEKPWRQIDRLDAYEAALQQLREKELLYRCFCTRKDLAVAIDAPQEGETTALYPGTCRGLSREEVSEKLARGLPFCWRLHSEGAGAMAGSLSFHDVRFGEVAVDISLMGDIVLARKDIATSYHLAVVVDDAAQEVTEVVRGEDLLESTHVHRVLQELLAFPVPNYLHHQLVVDEEGKRLAKRHDSLALATLRERGVTLTEMRTLMELRSTR